MIIEYCATRLISEMKIDFHPNKRRLILLSCPLQWISIDSRSPNGLRHNGIENTASNRPFQFTQPKRAATGWYKHWYKDDTFQFTQPKRAATCCQSKLLCWSWRFNSRSPNGLRQVRRAYHPTKRAFQFTQPKWVATGSWYCWHWFCHCFNSRSPNGLRPKTVGMVQTMHGFNSRSPNGLRLFVGVVNRKSYCVSIHAAQMGCDLIVW